MALINIGPSHKQILLNTNYIQQFSSVNNFSRDHEIKHLQGKPYITIMLMDGNTHDIVRDTYDEVSELRRLLINSMGGVL